MIFVIVVIECLVYTRIIRGFQFLKCLFPCNHSYLGSIRQCYCSLRRICRIRHVRVQGHCDLRGIIRGTGTIFQIPVIRPVLFRFHCKSLRLIFIIKQHFRGSCLHGGGIRGIRRKIQLFVFIRKIRQRALGRCGHRMISVLIVSAPVSDGRVFAGDRSGGSFPHDVVNRG